MASRRPATAVAAALVAAALLLAPVGGSPAAAEPDPAWAVARPAASLSVSPSPYVGGQSLRWQGSLGVAGRRRVSLQLNINRQGDRWQDVAGFAARTAGDGSFDFRYQAPAMFGISYRVVGGGRATPGVTFEARSQDLTLAVQGDHRGWYGAVTPDLPFTITVDTTPSLTRRQDVVGLPAFPGRTVTLQRRRADLGWETVATTTTDAAGDAAFGGLTEATGIAVYRVRQENWTQDGDRIGWFPSFPYYVYSGTTAPDRAKGQPAGARTGEESGAASDQAANRFGWGAVVYDFGWEHGESLTSPPDRGTDRDAYWLDTSDGSGRALHYNGGMALVSGRTNNHAVGDFGTTRVTLQRAAQRYGRWEVRLRTKVLEKGLGDYRLLAELVPADPDDRDCGAHDVVIAEARSNGTTLTWGANDGTTRWRRTSTIDSLDTQAPAFAVEVAADHITWFADSRIIGTVGRQAVSGLPMTLRLSMVGDGDAEMNHATLISDWQRAYPLDRGRQVRRGPALTRTTVAAPTC